jgi:hypothetical protein
MIADEGLSALLARVVEQQTARNEQAAKLKEMDKELERLESQAAEQLGASGLDGCRVAGKTWWIDEALRLTVVGADREKLLEAAKAERLEDAVTLNTATLKTWLKERSDQTGCSLEDAVKGTRFDGLVGQYVEIRLRSRVVA